MNDDVVTLLTGNEIARLLDGKERQIIECVKEAYSLHDKSKTVVPHSLFLRFPDNDMNRIIALPAYLGGRFGVAGMKWIASFPNNIAMGIERASAVIVLNSPSTGRPYGILEGSVVSSLRTAAGAALATSYLLSDEKLESLGIIGCGLINFQIVKLILHLFPNIATLNLCDLSLERRNYFKDKCMGIARKDLVISAGSYQEILQKSRVISLATTAREPYIYQLPETEYDYRVLLNVSLRDLSPEIISASMNCVDDADHVCRAKTSIHLAVEKFGNKKFIDFSLGQLINNPGYVIETKSPVRIFSPFGLGILDLALSSYVLDLARQEHVGLDIQSFFPQ